LGIAIQVHVHDVSPRCASRRADGPGGERRIEAPLARVPTLQNATFEGGSMASYSMVSTLLNRWVPQVEKMPLMDR
jgi:hypothetical protein